MKKANVKTTTYETGIENFLMDITEYQETLSDGTTEQLYGCWIYREDIGIKDFVVGQFKKDLEGVTVKQYAQQMLDYCLVNYGSGNSFDIYDEQYNY